MIPAPTRRRFATVALAAAAAGIALPAHAAAIAEGDAMNNKQLHILILGGTGFLGPATIESALARGHKVSIFNSGRSEERRQAIGRPSVIPEGDVEVIIGNRDPQKTADDRRLAQLPPDADATPDPDSPKGLTNLKGREFDAVIDTSGYFPRHVKASAELLAPNVGQYVFISTLSVYESNEKPGMDESAPLGALEDPTVETMGPNSSYYGPLKALCEQAAEEAMPGRATVIRPGFIVGPRDTSARFMFWPVRISKGGEMPIPGEEDTLIQVIDVRDLADFTIHCIEQNITGTFNATGEPMTMKTFVEAIRKGVEADTTFTFLGTEFAEAQQLGFGQYPLYIPQDGEYAGFHQRDVSKAIDAGLTFRPLSDTAKVTLEWYNDLPADIQSRVVPQGMLTPEREQEILAAHKNTDSEPGGEEPKKRGR